MPIPILDLEAQYKPIKDQVRQAIEGVLTTHRYIGGPEVESFEKEIAQYCGTKHAIGVSSGTDALVVSLLALDVGPGDEVITTPFTFFATAGSVWRRGAKLRFVDIDPVTFNLDVSQVKQAINERTKAIIPVHLFGQCVDIKALKRVIEDRPIAILEDCAQAIGAERDGQRAGAMGDLGAFSFFPSKNLGGIADGGMVTTDSDELETKVRLLRNHGGGGDYVHKVVGGNFRLDAINAAVLRVKLPHLDRWAGGRQHNAQRYRSLFQEAGLPQKGVVLPAEDPTANQLCHIYNQFVCRFPNSPDMPGRDQVQQALAAKQIGCAVYYPIALHLQECFKDLGYQKGDFPQAEKASQEVLALPIYGELEEDQLREITGVIASVYN